MPQRVLHILGTAQSEGAGIVGIVEALAAGLDPTKYALHAIFLREGGPLTMRLSDAGVAVHAVRWCRGARDPAGAWRFWHTLRGLKFALIHQHFGGRSVRWLARKATGGGTLVHLHGRASESASPVPALIRAQSADAVIAVSQAVARCVIGAPAQVVYPGVPSRYDDAMLAAEQNRMGQVIGAAGRFVAIKGLVYLLRAVAQLGAEATDVRVEIAGSGPERHALECEVEALGLVGRVKFLGWQDRLEPAMANWDIFVQPSLEEGFGIGALQAMATGLPVVATAVGGLTEVVIDGGTGWLVPPGDATALAARLRWLLLNPQQRRVMGAAGRARARECFSVDRMVSEVSGIYDRLLSTTPPATASGVACFLPKPNG
jgi:glycosyltransferase involved in cell wall biosynthesis